MQQRMRLKVFSKVYCDRVYFLCAERFVTGSDFEPPVAPPYPFERRVPPSPRALSILRDNYEKENLKCFDLSVATVLQEGRL